MQDIQRR